MHIATRIAIASASAVAIIGLMAGAANASVSNPEWGGGSTTATTRIYNVGIPGNGGNWASDSVQRTATINGGQPVAPSYCGESTGSCYSFTASVRDQGTFRAFDGALTPNQSTAGKRIKSTVAGFVSGHAFFGTFYANARPDAGLVPRFAYHAYYVANWPARFFPSGTTIAGLHLGPWVLDYYAWTNCGFQHWIDASSNGYGDLPRDGNIAGCRYLYHPW
jgi:hypothetical protein